MEYLCVKATTPVVPCPLSHSPVHTGNSELGTPQVTDVKTRGREAGIDAQEKAFRKGGY
jgi:hypothetical protein